jgi:hypothetical protein
MFTSTLPDECSVSIDQPAPWFCRMTMMDFRMVNGLDGEPSVIAKL